EEDQDPDVPGRRGADAPEQEERQRDDEQSLLPILIAELAEDWSGNRCDEQEDRQHRGHPGRRRMELALERRERRNHHRLLQRVAGAADRQYRERPVVVLAPWGH